MDFDQLKGIDTSKLFTSMPSFCIDTSLVEENQRRLRESLDSIPSAESVLSEQLRPLVEGNQKVIDGLFENYIQLKKLYELKEKELADSKDETTKAKSYNTKMLVIALVSLGIALASLVASILIAVL